MSKTDLKNIIESLLFAADKPLSIKELSKISGGFGSDVQKVLSDLTKDYQDRGIKLIRKGEYFSFVTSPDCAKHVSLLLNEELRHDLSDAAIETLAVITYKQPITRLEIENLRGVNCDQLIRSLMIRGLIHEVGRKETIGRPILYGTTMEFIQYFGLEKEEDLPKLKDETLFKDQ